MNRWSGSIFVFPEEWCDCHPSQLFCFIHCSLLRAELPSAKQREMPGMLLTTCQSKAMWVKCGSRCIPWRLSKSRINTDFEEVLNSQNRFFFLPMRLTDWTYWSYQYHLTYSLGEGITTGLYSSFTWWSSYGNSCCSNPLYKESLGLGNYCICCLEIYIDLHRSGTSTGAIMCHCIMWQKIPWNQLSPVSKNYD